MQVRVVVVVVQIALTVLGLTHACCGTCSWWHVPVFYQDRADDLQRHFVLCALVPGASPCIRPCGHSIVLIPLFPWRLVCVHAPGALSGLARPSFGVAWYVSLVCLWTHLNAIVSLTISLSLYHTGAFFVFDLSPFMVKVENDRVPFTHFLVKICAIIGGVVSVRGFSSFRPQKALALTHARALDRWLCGLVHVQFAQPQERDQQVWLDKLHKAGNACTPCFVIKRTENIP